jgi:ABC-type microcin C transport system duplicated ATPase subunit YejF
VEVDIVFQTDYCTKRHCNLIQNIVTPCTKVTEKSEATIRNIRMQIFRILAQDEFNSKQKKRYPHFSSFLKISKIILLMQAQTTNWIE